uniref:Uncharacterized protein n=1 Tax=Arundo donax TaxID=35708 RepID=A0A0A9B2L6_ARUDO
MDEGPLVPLACKPASLIC